MHHFRGSLKEGDRTKIDPANVYLEFHGETPGSTDERWDGYLLVAEEKDVEPGKSYTLRLVDGRSGNLTIQTLAPDDSGKFRALFVGVGRLL